MACWATSSRRGARDEGTIRWLRNVRRGFAHHARKAEDGEYEARAALKRAQDHLVYACAYKTSEEAIEAESAMRATRRHWENVRDRFEDVRSDNFIMIVFSLVVLSPFVSFPRRLARCDLCQELMHASKLETCMNCRRSCCFACRTVGETRDRVVFVCKICLPTPPPLH